MKTLAGPQSGALADIVASRNRSGQFLRKRVTPRNPRTAAQRRARKNIRKCRACGTTHGGAAGRLVRCCLPSPQPAQAGERPPAGRAEVL